MKLFQMVVFTLVLFSNVRWKWTPNGYLASLIAMGATFLATVFVIKVVETVRWLVGLRAMPRSDRSGRERRAERAVGNSDLVKSRRA